jgi:RDD family protein
MVDYQHHQPPNQAYAPQPPYPYAYSQPTPPPPAVPEEVGDTRRMLFSGVDGAITIVGGLGLATQLTDESGGTWWIYAVACVFGVSFVHHVLGTWVFTTTVGKFLLVTRVVREADAGRPRFWQIVGRWLLGLTWLPMQPLRALVWSDGDPYEDACGLRYVRSRDLRR